jgi:hypothetical protein
MSVYNPFSIDDPYFNFIARKSSISGISRRWRIIRVFNASERICCFVVSGFGDRDMMEEMRFCIVGRGWLKLRRLASRSLKEVNFPDGKEGSFPITPRLMSLGGEEVCE